MLIHVIRHDPDMGVAHQDIGQRLQLGPVIARAGGVRGRVEDEPFGFRRDRRLKLRGRQFEIVFNATFHRHRGAASQQNHIGVRDPIGRGDDHLIAGVTGGHQRIVENLLAAGANGDLVRRIFQPVFAFELGADRLFQLGDTIDRGITRLALVDRTLGRRADVFRRVEIRLACAQTDDIAALCLQLGRLGGDGDGGRGFDTGEGIGQEGHGRAPGLKGSALS